MNIEEYKKQNTLHIELPSGLVFDAKAPSGLLVARWQARIVNINPETEWNEAMTAMLQEFEHCLPDGLKIEDFTAEDYAALIGIVSPFFEKTPFPSQFGSAKPSELGISNTDSGLTTT
jgi:hypothetical protein